jgi:4-hydroxybutyryl-CoA dehydratase/vinylacetyl-CoA-Delta-isomerase
MKSGSQFIEELKQLRPLIYFRGEKIKDFMNHPVLQPVINAARATYDLALKPENAERMLTESTLTGENCNLLGALLQTEEDLVKSVKLRRWWQNTTGTCNAGRCAGNCAANALYNGTYIVDHECNTEYHARFKEFFYKVQKEDKICAAGVMCVKGDRSMGPLGQQDPDLYLRVVEKNSRGIIVRGAKAHQTNGALSHEILVMPLRALGRDEKDYAVSFAVQNGTKGLLHVWQYNLHDSRRLLDKDVDLGNKLFGLEYHGTCLTIFKDVFVPWESVFLCGEYQYSEAYVSRFADLIRLCGGGCRPGAVDLAIGVMALLAEYSGIGSAYHIMEKLTNLAQMNEVGFGCALAAAYEGKAVESGLFFPNSLYANAARLNGTLTFAEAQKLLGDIAGGLIATSPSEMDFTSSEIGSLLQKYLQGKVSVPTEHRLRALRFAEMLGSGPPLHGLLCGGGTPETQKLVIRRNLKLEEKKNMVKKLAGIRD